MRQRDGIIGSVIALALVAGAYEVITRAQAKPAKQESREMIPHYEWDPYWPQRPLPNKWAVGNMGSHLDGASSTDGPCRA
jgi:hypothetical protein